jgi:hypothetical protein
MTCPSQSSRLNPPDYIRWTVQTMKFLIAKTSPLPIRMPLGPKYSLFLCRGLLLIGLPIVLIHITNDLFSCVPSPSSQLTHTVFQELQNPDDSALRKMEYLQEHFFKIHSNNALQSHRPSWKPLSSSFTC